MLGLFVHRKLPGTQKSGRDFVVELGEWRSDSGIAMPHPSTMTDFQIFSFSSARGWARSVS